MLGCPIGTVGSRLSRGRDRLKSRLVQRDLLPSAAATGIALGREAGRRDGCLSHWSRPRLASPFTSKLAGPWAPSRRRPKLWPAPYQGACDDPVQNARDGGRGHRAACSSPRAGFTRSRRLLSPLKQRRPPADQPKAKPVATRQPQAGFTPVDDPANDPKRHQDSLLATVGNMRPLIKTDQGVSFQSREAILYKDGTVKLWLLDGREPVCPPLATMARSERSRSRMRQSS